MSTQETGLHDETVTKKVRTTFFLQKSNKLNLNRTETQSYHIIYSVIYHLSEVFKLISLLYLFIKLSEKMPSETLCPKKTQI
jgi:hypothetical protein